MITDKLSEFERYLSVNKGFDLVLMEIEKALGQSKEEGVYHLDNRRVFLKVMRSETDHIDNRMWEVHRDYIDVQCCLSGNEIIGFDYATNLKQSFSAYSEKEDIEFFSDGGGSFLKLQPGDFVIFFPGEAHKPLIKFDSNEVLKLVFKVKF